MSTLVVDTLKDTDATVEVDVVDIVTRSEITSANYLDFINNYDDVDETGTEDSTAALTEAMVEGNTVIIPKGTTILASPEEGLAGYLIVEGVLKLSGTCTLSCAVEVRGGSVYATSGAEATITGSFVAPKNVQVFTGTGSIYGVRHVYPEWWGAVADQTVDCTDALNAASACVENSAGIAGETRPTIELMSGKYLISSTWTIPSSANIGVHVKGQGIIFAGTRIVCSASFTDSVGVYVPALSDGTQRIADFILEDFGVVPETVGSGPSYGMQLGTDSLMMNGLRESQVSNLYLANFPTSLRLVNTRLIKFSRLGIWNNGTSTASTCLLIQALSKFCGDMSFENCQFVNTETLTSSHAIHITSNGTYSSSGDRAYQIAGIRFTECILYPAYQTVYITSLGGSRVEDLFFNNCQWDGNSYSMIYAVSSGSGSVLSDIQVFNNYMYGGNASTDSQIQFVTSTSGTMQNIRVDGNTLGNGTGRAVNFTTAATGDTVGVFVNNNLIINNNSVSLPAVEFGGGCTRVQFNNNTASREASQYFTYLAQFDTGATRYVATGNIAGGIAASGVINDVAADGDSVVANNV